VAELTGVLVGERIPNRVLEQALAGYFQRANLIALRELSLREVADRVEEDAPASFIALRDRLMVCITTAPSNGTRPASGAFGERGSAALAQSWNHEPRQIAQAGERVLPQDRWGSQGHPGDQRCG
jgi:hypothetical protein